MQNLIEILTDVVNLKIDVEKAALQIKNVFNEKGICEKCKYAQSKNIIFGDIKDVENFHLGD